MTDPCTATIDDAYHGLVRCTLEAGHTANHAGPDLHPEGRLCWFDLAHGATPHRAAEETKPSTPDRHTVDTITSDALDELYDERTRLERLARDRADRIEDINFARTSLRTRLAEQEEETMRQDEKAREAERERDQLREVLHVLRYGMARAVPAQLAAEYVVKLIDDTTELITRRAPDPCDRDQQHERAEQAEAELRTLRQAHDRATRAASQADAVTAETKRLMERRTTTLRERAEQAEAVITRVRALGERWRYTGDRKNTALPELLTALDGPAPAATEATGPFIDRPFRSHRTPTPAHACTYGERCPNCRD